MTQGERHYPEGESGFPGITEISQEELVETVKGIDIYQRDYDPKERKLFSGPQPLRKVILRYKNETENATSLAIYPPGGMILRISSIHGSQNFELPSLDVLKRAIAVLEEGLHQET